MDGASSPQESAEEEHSGGAADLDPRRPAAAAMVVPEEEGHGYVDSLLRTSLQLVRKGLPTEIRRQGLKLMLPNLALKTMLLSSSLSTILPRPTMGSMESKSSCGELILRGIDSRLCCSNTSILSHYLAKHLFFEWHMFQHLLSYRWDELRIEECWASGDISDLAAGLYGTTAILSSKNAIASLMAEAILGGGTSLLKDLLPSIIVLSNRGPTEAELAAFILKWISDFRIVCAVDLDGGQSEAILSGLDDALPNILLTLASSLKKYAGVLAENPEQLTVSSKKHGLTVAACLLAANAYAEWIPVVHLSRSGLIERCKSLLNLSNPHVLALRFFKVICQRRRPLYASEDYDTTMSLVFWMLMNISKDSLNKSKTHSGLLDEGLLEFAGRICECLVALGSFNMQFIIKDGNRAIHFFRQMLEYYQHYNIALHFRCLQFWLMVLMDLPKEKLVAPYPVAVDSAVNPASLTISTEKGNSGALVFVSDDICDGMLDISFKRILKKSTITSPEWLELWSDELHGKNGFIQYRSKLLDLIRLISYERPIIAASRAVQRISCIIGDASAITKYPKDLDAIESAQLGLETVVRAIFDDSSMTILETELPLQGICKIFDGLLVQLLSLNWTEPELVVILGRYLDSLCPFLRHFPDAVAMVVTKLLKLISSINDNCHDPSKAHGARLQICSCIIHISQAVDGAFLPSDMKDIFSIPHITEEAVLAFVESNLTAYSVEQKHASGEGNQDGGATHPSSGSYIMPSTPSTYMTSGLRPWENVESLGLSVALSYFHDLPRTQPYFSSSSDPYIATSNCISCTMNHKKLDQSPILCRRLYRTSFPLHGSVPISWLRLDAKFQNAHEAKSLNLITEFVGERNLGIAGTIPCQQEKGQLLLVEHIILSEAFTNVTSFPGIQDMMHLLTDVLNTLNKIWTQSDWEDEYMHYTYCLSRLYANDQFRRALYSLIKSFEKLLANRILESSGAWAGPSVSADYLYSSTLPKLMLPLILRVLNCIQVLWREPIITYDLSGVTTKDIKFIVENGKLPDNDEAEMQQSAKTWVHEFRETGYNVISLCASVKGAFNGLLDRSSIINILTENLGSVEFKHLIKLIHLVFIPLVEYCPRDCWDKWMVGLLKPVFSYCEEILYTAWSNFFREGRAKIPAYLGNPRGPEEIVDQYEKELLLKFTRSVSDLLRVLALESRNSGFSLMNSQLKTSTTADVQDLKSISSNSIIGHLLLHNCFGRLSMYLFGCLTDYQVVENALPFCYYLIHIARATNHERLNQFILNEMLPTAILLLGEDVKSAISQFSCSLNSATKEDARNNVTCLCLEIYRVYMDNQVTSGEGVSDRFKDWLAKELECLHIRASYAVPEDFPKDDVWNWEFNEEFERYLPTYMKMLEEVDAMDDCLEDNYLEEDILLEKLRPEFKSRYGINSYMHPYLQTISSLLQRKMPAVHYWKHNKLISQCLDRLITLKPYVKHTDSWNTVYKRLREICEPQCDFWPCNPASAVDIFRGSILFYWEPQFHPLIREAHKELLKTIACQLALADKSVLFEPLEPQPNDFLEHLRPYARMYIERKKKEFGFFNIEEQVRLHEEFDNHLASSILDNRKNEFSCFKDKSQFAVSDLVKSQCCELNHDLVAMSLERIHKIVEWENQISLYSECLTSVLENDEMKDELGNLMNVLKETGFFSVDDDRVDWDNKLFSDSIDKFKKMVFPMQSIDKRLVIRGIMDYQQISQMMDVNWQDAFRMVVTKTNDLWKENLQQFWVNTRHYEHKYYDTLAQPLQKVFLEGGVPKPRYG